MMWDLDNTPLLGRLPHPAPFHDQLGPLAGIMRHSSGSLARGEHAELVALGVGHDHPADRAGILADIDPPGAKRLQAPDFGGLVPVWRRGQVDVQPVLNRLTFRQGFMF